MIAVCVFHLVCSQQGGAHMCSRPSSHEVQVAPIQVWPALSSDLRTRIVGLLAQLTVNMAVAHPGNTCVTKEVGSAYSTPIPKNPSRPS
jgi:hypothetical protein